MNNQTLTIDDNEELLKISGAVFGQFLTELDQPPEVKEAILHLVKIWPEEELNILFSVIEEALIQQLVTQSNPAYIKAVAEIDDETIVELEKLLATVENK